jgi:predicted cupin superfamily sugar epimerase
VVAPGFDFNDFELFTRKALLEEFPEEQAVIERLTVG